MESMPFLSEVPALSDLDVNLWISHLADYISVWLRNTPQFIFEQKQKMLLVALCPFLFGVTHSVPLVWQEVLHINGVISQNRANETTPLTETELEILEMAETIFTRCSQLVENKNDLKTILNFIHDVEERHPKLERIDLNYALQSVVDLGMFASMWAPIRRIYESRKRQAHICIIYYFKIISQNVLFYGRGGVDKSNYLKRLLSDVIKPKRVSLRSVAEENTDLIYNNFKLSADQYSSKIKVEPLNSLLYSNRAQVFLNDCDYRSALCDSKRAILLDPKNYKHYMWAAKSYLELGQLDKAEETNNQSLKLCTDPQQREAILQQSQEIRDKSRMTKAVTQNEVNSGSEELEVDNVHVQYRRLVCDGFSCYSSKLYSRAMEQFKSALNMLARPENEGLTITDDDELMILSFFFGMSCVKTANIRARTETKNIQAAIEAFSTIISRSEEFPAIYYGLGLAYMALKRYKEAEADLRKGLEQISKYSDADVYMGPQAFKEFDETNIHTVKKLMEESLQECLHPPKPDAVCKFHTDSSKREIYISDPDYKGHICIKCRADCFIEFHPQCWKITDNFRKHNWKEMLDTACPTPGCWGLISDVFICRPDQEKSLKLSSQADFKPKKQPPLPKLKMKSESTSKLERKLEKKRLRKERRQEAQGLNLEESEENTPSAADIAYLVKLDEEEAARNLDRSGTLLLKDDPEVTLEHKKQKASKNKKKEKKQKQFLALDVQFKGDENKERFGINSLDDEGDIVNRPIVIVNPELLPAPGSGLTPPTDRPQSLQSSNMSSIDKHLYDFFYRFLSEKGPLDLFGKDVEDQIKLLPEMAQTRIHHCDGLVSFLSSDPRFSISQNNIISTELAGQHAVPHRVAQRNPWERHKLEESINSSNFHGLNPGAKEFIPQDALSASDSHSSDPAELTDSFPAFAESAANELPPPAQDSDDGFTTVVNKKRINAHVLPSAGQPDTYKYYLMKPASSYNSLDDIQLDLKRAPKKSVENLDKEESEHLKTVMSCGRVDTSHASWNDHAEIHPARSSPGVPLSVPLGFVTNNTSRGSDASDVSGEDIHRVSSPALSTNSGSSSSRTDSNQVSGQMSTLRPLKAPAISLPTRGKKKKPLGHISSKLYSHPFPPSADRNLIYDGYEEESVSSTTSDRDSSCGDPRPLVTEKSLPATSEVDTPSSAAGKDSISATKSSFSDIFSKRGQDSFIYGHHQNTTFEPESSPSEFKTTFPGHIMYPKEYIPSNQRLGTNFQVLKDETGSQNCSHENCQIDLKFSSSNKSVHVSFGAQENFLRNKIKPSSVKSSQQPIQKSQPKSQDLGQAEAKSEKKMTLETKTFPDTTWPFYNYFSTPKSYTTDNEVRIEADEPTSDPWLKLGNEFFSLSTDDVFYRKGRIEQQNHLISADTNSQSSDHVLSKHNDSEVFPPVQLLKDFVGSEKIIQKDPWSKAVDKQRSHPSRLSDVKNESSPFSSFEAWNQPPTRDHLLYTSSTYTPESTTGIQSTVTLPANTGTNSRSNTPVKSNPVISTIPCPPESAKSLPWAVSDADINAFHSKATEYKTAEVQTTLTGTEINEMRVKLKLLKESHAAKEAALLEKLQLQEALTNSEKQLTREKLVMEKLKLDVKKLVTRIQTAETTAEKWKNDSDQLVKDNHRLQVQNQANADDMLEVNKQLEMERLKFFNAQMEILELKSVIAKDRLDVKRQEAVQHFQRLANVISKGDTASRSFPESVYKKHKELSSYIKSCDTLKQQIEMNVQRLKQDLIQGITVDLSKIDVTPPAFPQPPSELTDRSQASSHSGSQAKIRDRDLAPPSYSMESVKKAPKPAVHLEDTTDEDSKAYLSMFYGDSMDSAEAHPRRRDANFGVGRGTTYDWDVEDVVKGKKQASFKPSAQLPAPWASSKATHPTRPLSPAVPTWEVLSGISTPPGKKSPKAQSEAIGAAFTSNVRLQTQHLRTHASQKFPENVQHTKQTYFERIVALVEENLPGCSRVKIQQTVDKLRRNNGGSLSDWTVEELANRVLDTILDSEQDEFQADDSTLDEHLSNHSSKLSIIDFQCSICQSEIEPLESLSLVCGHKFHEPCLQKWLKSNRTCPICRSHALLPQDFPTLK